MQNTTLLIQTTSNVSNSVCKILHTLCQTVCNSFIARVYTLCVTLHTKSLNVWNLKCTVWNKNIYKNHYFFTDNRPIHTYKTKYYFSSLYFPRDTLKKNAATSILWSEKYFKFLTGYLKGISINRYLKRRVCVFLQQISWRYETCKKNINNKKNHL